MQKNVSSGNDYLTIEFIKYIARIKENEEDLETCLVVNEETSEPSTISYINNGIGGCGRGFFIVTIECYCCTFLFCFLWGTCNNNHIIDITISIIFDCIVLQVMRVFNLCVLVLENKVWASGEGMSCSAFRTPPDEGWRASMFGWY